MSDFTFSGPTITGYTGAGGAITLPSMNGSIVITTIGEEAFAFSHNPAAANITSIDATSTSITTIQDSAFYQLTNVTSILLPATLETVGSFVFYLCSKLTSLTFPNSVTSIGTDLFHNCVALNAITFPSGITTINDNMCVACTALTSVTIPSSVLSIGVQAFYFCTNLSSITLPSGLLSIGDYAFRNCNALTSVTFPSGLQSIGAGSFNPSGLTSVTLSPGTTINTTSSYESFASSVTIIRSGGGGGGVACFTAGTMILTPGGEVAVETLKAGDLVTTASGLTVPLTAALTTHVVVTTVETAPYLIPSGTFGAAQPRDLILSPTHFFQIRKGVWIPAAGAALRSSKVCQIHVGQPVTYYHLECPVYLRDNLVANGCIVESFGGRQTKRDPYTYSKHLKGSTRTSFSTTTHAALR